MDRYAGAGVALVALGLGIVIAPGLAPFALDAWVVALVGVVALVQGINRVRERRRTPIVAEELPAIERPEDLPRPGEEFDAALESGDLESLRAGPTRKRVNERLEAAAVDALVRYRDRDEAAAREALAAGTWTDDPWAAAQFAGGFPEWAPLRERLRSWTVRSRRARRAARAADEIARIADVDAAESSDPEASEPAGAEGSS